MNLTHWRFDTDQDNWAMTQNNLAIALRNQALRVEGAAGADLLARAVTAYEVALEVRTREDAPQDWAETQANLGSLYVFSAARSDNTKQDLATALEYYRAALEIFDPVHTSYYHTICSAARDQVLAELAALDKTP